MRYLGAILCLLLVACSTTSPNLFSGKPVVQIDQGQAFVLYIKAIKIYEPAKLYITQYCAAPTAPKDFCDQMKAADDAVQRINEEIMTSLTNPTYPLDMNKVNAFIDKVMETLARAGVKAVTGGILP